MEWYTPPDVFRALGLAFDLDPCAPVWPRASWIPADLRYSLPDDGLSLPWTGRVWLNPPYARDTAKWLGRLEAHGNGIALVFARTDTAWFQSALARAEAVCFIEGRINFVPAVPRRASNGTKSNAGSPSCLIGFGPECAEAVINCGLGLVMYPAGNRRQLELSASA